MGYTVPEGAKVERTYAGKHQKAEGACSWMLSSDSGKVFSSQWTVSEVVKNGFTVESNKYSGDYEIYPNEL